MMMTSLVILLALLIQTIYIRRRILSSEADLQAALDAIQADVTTIGNQFAAFKQTIADLQAQIAAGTPVTQAQLDALVAEANAIDASFKALS